MAMFNSSFSNPSGFGASDSKFRFLNSNLGSGLNGVVNGNDLINSSIPRPSSPTTGLLLPQNNPFQSNQYPTFHFGSGTSSAQLAMTTGVRMPYIGQPRVSVHTLADRCNHQYYPGLTEVYITEVKTTRFLTPTSTADRLLHLQPSGISRGEALYEYSTSTANRLQLALARRDNNYNSMRNEPRSQSMLASSSNVQRNFHQFLGSIPGMDDPPLTRQALVNQNFNNRLSVMDNRSLGLVPKEVLDPEPVSVYVPEDHPGGQQISGNIELLEIEQKPNVAGAGGPSNRMNGESSQQVEEVDESDDNSVGYDGRTHGISYGLYGPYKCPKCWRIFPTSQHFASHTLTHYRNEETAEQKRKRLEARSRGLRFRITETTDGLSVCPDEEEMKRLNKRGRQAASGN
ncbi:hypothetical protein SLEP1_g23711 [Rubroshorea leprosula]|uniref:C2H2-type domain-containing protein n=1 Tax=Rubroshorea leprosula TaxID=152421 RepID=A0AAV5JJH0_9ROSI|nr:hypothetical protein SLEP1_g23711 [Rubroshorea leprosula]